jgi:hypothetical protein
MSPDLCKSDKPYCLLCLDPIRLSASIRCTFPTSNIKYLPHCLPSIPLLLTRARKQRPGSVYALHTQRSDSVLPLPSFSRSCSSNFWTTWSADRRVFDMKKDWPQRSNFR